MFPKSLRIKKSSDFKLLFTKGKSFHSPQLKLQVLYGGTTTGSGKTALAAKPGYTPTVSKVGANIPTKYAVITPKGVGKAHDRNRIRRQLLAQLRAWHEERNGKIGKIGTADNIIAGSANTITMLAIYVKVPKQDLVVSHTDLTLELESLIYKLESKSH